VLHEALTIINPPAAPIDKLCICQPAFSIDYFKKRPALRPLPSENGCWEASSAIDP